MEKLPVSSQGAFVQKVIITIIAVLVTVLLIFLVKFGAKILMMLFAAALLAILYRGIASWFANKTGINANILVPVVVLIHLGIIVLVIYLLAPRVGAQIQSLSQQLPGVLKNIKQSFLSSGFGQFIMEQMPESRNFLQHPGQIFKTAINFFTITLSVFIDFIVIFGLALFLAFSPDIYRRGFVQLFPLDRRKRVEEVWETVNVTLFKWFMGKIVDMSTIFVATALFLWILGIPLVLTLALIAFLFSFIPNIGPIISAIPALLLAFTKGLDYMLYVGLGYLAIQLLESYFVTPNVQRKAIQMPQVLLIVFQLLMARFTGILGLFISTPLLGAFMVVVKMVYVEDILKDTSMKVRGEEQAKRVVGGK